MREYLLSAGASPRPTVLFRLRVMTLLTKTANQKKSLSRDWERLSFFYAKNLRLLMTASTTRAAELMVIRVRWVKM